MSQTNTASFGVEYSVSVNQQSLTKAKSELTDIPKALKEALDQVMTSASRQFDVFLTGMAQDVNKTWEATEKAFGDYTKSALKDSVVAVFQGEMDQVEDIWGKAWDGMAAKVEGLWEKLPDMAINRAMTGLENMFKDLVWKPVSDWFTSLLPTDLLNFFGKGTTGAAGGGAGGDSEIRRSRCRKLLWAGLSVLLAGRRHGLQRRD